MARLFDGSNYLLVESAAIGSVPLTISCWFNTDDDASLQTLVWVGDSGQSDRYYSLDAAGSVAGDPVRLYRRNDNAIQTVTTSGYTVNTWHHAAAICTAADDAEVLIDGGSSGTSVVAAAPNGWNRTSIGSSRDSSPGYLLSGAVAEAAIWSAALTTAEVAILAAGYSPLLVRPQSLVFYCPLIRDNDEDIVGGLSFTATGGPTVAAHPPVRYAVGAYNIAVPVVAGISIPVVMHHLRQQGIS